MIPQTSFKRLVLRVVLRDVYPMVIRLMAVPDFLLLTDFDDLFHALLGWESGAGYAFRLHGQEFNSLRRRTKTKKLSDFRLHRQERFLYTLGFMDQWEWEIRVIDLQDGSESDEKPVCLDGRGATPPQYCGGPTGYRLMLRRQEQREQMCSPAERDALAKLMEDTHPDQPADTWEVLRSALAQGYQSLDRRLEQSGPLQPERFSLREANQRLEKLLAERRFV